ncbi:hypothetical protein SteCoe_24834 [Stentor coeruleus]|uniref:Uncharacterized protein n=1 Tax=Stentor coeruleus TaxID=5963 RepID=A0A1R2BGP8_9CILI|nr:hypothetical protein SteCoe_24834 [Stentor coeruleus]
MEEIKQHIDDMKNKVQQIKENNKRLEYEIRVLDEEVKRKKNEIKTIKESEGSPFMKFKELKQREEELKNTKDDMIKKLEEVKKKKNEILIERDNKIHKNFIEEMMDFESIKAIEECLNKIGFEELKKTKDELIERCNNLEIEISRLEEEGNTEERKIDDIMKYLDKTKEELVFL